MVAVLVEDTHEVFDVKSLSVIVEKLGEVTIRLELSLIELLASEFVNEMSSGPRSHPAVLVDALAPLVNEEALVGLEEMRHHRSRRARSSSSTLSAATFTGRFALSCFRVSIMTGVFLEVKISHNVMGVEIVLLHTVGRRHFTTVIHLSLVEHFPLSVVVEDVAGSIHQVTTLVGGISILILDVAFIILEDDNIALFIAVEISKNIALIEVSLVHEGRDINWLRLISEVLKGLFTHLDSRSVNS